MLPRLNPFEYFTDTNGDPLDGGYVYIGTANQNPKTSPVTVYFDSAMTIPAPQPLRTTAGRIVKSGSPAAIYSNAATFSILVENKSGQQVAYTAQAENDAAANMAALAASSGSSLIGVIQSDGGAVARTVEDELLETVKPQQFGAVGDGVTDDKAAIQLFINYCRDTPAKGFFPNDGSTYRINSGLVTQHDGSYKAIEIDFNNAPIVAYFSGSAALIVTGGAARQKLWNVNLSAGAGYTSATGVDTVSHGIWVSNAKHDITGQSNNFKGHGVLIESSAPNSNDSSLDVFVGGNNRGLHMEGTNDNLSILDYAIHATSNHQEGVFIDPACMVRDSRFWIYAEANCVDSTALTAVDIGKARTCEWLIYSEQQTAAQEIIFRTDCTDNRIKSQRNNKDSDAGSRNVWLRGNRVVRGGWNVQAGGSIINATSQTADANADDLVVGGGSGNVGITVNHGTGIGAFYFQNNTSATYSGFVANGASLYLRAGGVGNVLQANAGTSINPTADNATTLGTGALRWSVVYAATGAINTSDARNKQQVRSLSDAEKAAAVRCKSLIKAYKFNDAVEQKGESARWHFGWIAQEVKAAFEDEGLDAFAYGLLCYDEWGHSPAVFDDASKIIVDELPHGNRYGVRYDELLCFVISST